MPDTHHVDPSQSTVTPTPQWNSDPDADPSAARNIGAEFVAAVRERTGLLVTEQLSRAAAEIDTVAVVLRSAVRSVDEKNRGAIAECAEAAALEVEQFADRVRHTSPSTLAADVEDFGRRWPLAFMASAIGTGFIAGCLLMNSGSKPEGQNPGDEMQPEKRRPDERTGTESAASAFSAD